MKRKPDRAASKPGRNVPCPCRSGRKYKKCHGSPKPTRDLPLYGVNAKAGTVAVKDDPTRSCGDCQACCEAMNIASIEKPVGQRCVHQCPVGCEVYGEHPNECAEYSCWWRAGWGRDEDRPDKLGVIVDTALSENADVWAVIPLIVMREARPGVFDKAGLTGGGISKATGRVGEIARQYYTQGNAVVYHCWGDPSPVDLHANPHVMAMLEAKGIV